MARNFRACLAAAGAGLIPFAGSSLAAPQQSAAPAQQGTPPAQVAPAGQSTSAAPESRSIKVQAADAATPLIDPPPVPLPLAPAVIGPRPKSNPAVLPPAATRLDPALQRLAAPATLALPTKVEQVRIQALRPLSLKDVENLAEVNNPNLKAIASQVDQASVQPARPAGRLVSEPQPQPQQLPRLYRWQSAQHLRRQHPFRPGRYQSVHLHQPLGSHSQPHGPVGADQPPAGAPGERRP